MKTTPQLYRGLGLLCGALAALTLFPRQALAVGEITGRVAGYVYDPTGAALSEVPLTITSSALMQPISRQTGDDGRYEFDNLPPGEDYALEVNVPGFTPIKQTGIKVRTGQTTPVDVALSVLTETQAVATYQIVEKVNPVLNPDSAQATSVITAEKVATTPIFHQVEGMPQQVAGVGPGSRPSTKGGFARYGKFYVDGMDTSDISDGSITSPINFDAVENFEVITGGFDAQYNSLGLVENVVTKSGGNEFKIDTSITVATPYTTASKSYANTNPGFTGDLTNASPPPGSSFYSPILNVSGPIIKDKLWFFIATQANIFDTTNPITTFPLNQLENRPNLSRLFLGRVKLTYQPSQDDRISLALSIDHNKLANQIGDASAARDAEKQTIRGGQWGILNFDHNFSDNVLFQLQTGLTYKASRIDPMQLDQNGNPDLGTPGHLELNSGTASINAGSFSHEEKYRFELDPTLSWRLKGAGTHQMKAGVQAAYLYDWQKNGFTGDQRFLDRNGVCDPVNAPQYCNQVVNYYNTSLQQGPQETKASVLTIGTFIQDRWNVNKNLTLIPGLRFDLGKYYGNDGNLITNQIGLGPRMSATFDVFADRKSLIVAHYGRSNDVTSLVAAQRANPSVLAVTSPFVNGAFQQCDPNNPAAGCQVSGGLAGQAFANNQSPPHVDELMLGFHQEIAPETVLGLDGTYRYYGNMWANEEINRVWDPSGTKVVGYVDGVAHTFQVAQTPSSAYRRYTGADLWFQGTPGRWDILASYTLAFAKGTVSDYFDGYLGNPRFTQFYDGYASDDRRHTVKGSVTYKTSFGLDIGVRLEFRTGSPLWQNFSNGADTLGNAQYRSPRGTGYAFTPNGNGAIASTLNDPSQWSDIRNPDTMLWHLQGRYNLGELLKMQQKLDVIGLFSNVLNNTEAAGYFDRYSSFNNRYGLASFHNNPFQFELLVRYRN